MTTLELILLLALGVETIFFGSALLHLMRRQEKHASMTVMLESLRWLPHETAHDLLDRLREPENKEAAHDHD
jgi:hypothetical protein